MNPLIPLAYVDMNWLVPVTMFFFIFGGGGMVRKIIESMNRTRVEMAQLRSQQQGSASSQELAALRDDVSALRRELQQLRDTSTQYDISFDSALQRMESRVEFLERNRNQTDPNAVQNQYLGGRQ